MYVLILWPLKDKVIRSSVTEPDMTVTHTHTHTSNRADGPCSDQTVASGQEGVQVVLVGAELTLSHCL